MKGNDGMLALPRSWPWHAEKPGRGDSATGHESNVGIFQTRKWPPARKGVLAGIMYAPINGMNAGLSMGEI